MSSSHATLFSGKSGTGSSPAIEICWWQLSNLQFTLELPLCPLAIYPIIQCWHYWHSNKWLDKMTDFWMCWHSLGWIAPPDAWQEGQRLTRKSDHCRPLVLAEEAIPDDSKSGFLLDYSDKTQRAKSASIMAEALHYTLDIAITSCLALHHLIPSIKARKTDKEAGSPLAFSAMVEKATPDGEGNRWPLPSRQRGPSHSLFSIMVKVHSTFISPIMAEKTLPSTMAPNQSGYSLSCPALGLPNGKPISHLKR